MGDRIWKTTIGKFDQVLALTQYSINSSLQAQYDYAAAEQGFAEPVDVRLSARFGNQGFYNTVFGACRARIDYSSGNRRTCTFRMLLRNSTLKVYYAPESVGDFVTCYRLRNFFLANPVNLDDIEIDNNSRDGKRISDLMGPHKPGDYSIRQLFLNFNSAQVIRIDLENADFGVWTDDDWILKDINVPTPPTGASPTNNYWRPDGWARGQPRVIDGVALQNLRSLFQHSIDNHLKDANAGQVGFVVCSNRRTAGDPTFVPTALRFQTYPWSDHNGPVQPSFDGTGLLNYYLYLEMTNGAPLPTGNDEYLNVNGNWTNNPDPNNGSLADFATFVLRRSRFVDEWLVPKLSKLNRMMNGRIQSPWLQFNGNILKWWLSFSFPVLIGANVRGYEFPDAGDHAYSMTFREEMPSTIAGLKVRAGANFSDVLPVVPRSTLCWYAYRQDNRWDKNDADWGNRCDTTTHTESCSRFSIAPATNVMVLEGLTRLDYGYEVRSTWGQRTRRRWIVFYSWKVVITMKDVTDGGLAFRIDTPTLKVDWQENSTRFNIRERVDQNIEVARRNLTNLISELRNFLEGEDKFVFPSRGRFFFKDAMFGHQGDLVVKTAYNGLEYGNANPETREERDRSRPSSFTQVETIPFGGDEEEEDPTKL